MAFILYHVFQMNGWFRWEWWTEHVARPFGGGLFDPQHAAVTAAAVHSEFDNCGNYLCRGRYFGRVSPGQRAVDDGHYLGRLDHSACPALGEYSLRFSASPC